MTVEKDTRSAFLRLEFGEENRRGEVFGYKFGFSPGLFEPFLQPRRASGRIPEPIRIRPYRLKLQKFEVFFRIF